MWYDERNTLKVALSKSNVNLSLSFIFCRVIQMLSISLKRVAKKGSEERCFLFFFS